MPPRNMLVGRWWKGRMVRCLRRTAKQRAHRIVEIATGVMAVERNGRKVPKTCHFAVSDLLASTQDRGRVWSAEAMVYL
eukprot:3709775-Rhodomonas_salina.1